MSLAMLHTTQSALSGGTHLKRVVYGWRSGAQRPASKQAHDEQFSQALLNAVPVLRTNQSSIQFHHFIIFKASQSWHYREIRTACQRCINHHTLPTTTCPLTTIVCGLIYGGGIRGVSQLVILDEIMKRIQVKKHLTEVPKPCEYFHLIGGSGTGDLNAIMLGHLKMSTEDALHNYKKLATAVFSPDNHKPFYKDGKFKASTLEVEIREIVKNSCVEYTGDELLLDPDAGKGSISNVFGPDLRIWEASRATTATATIFKAIMVVGLGGISVSYIDAGLGHNNPSKEVRDEAMQLFARGLRKINYTHDLH
ncbi:acyl transferase/acyl hydrolase/lysophospholipase [Armillaria fumosa]|nr:acyl transferase/acyl hydrolase/lysophospholipase [Armillaria fumosa]